MSHAPTDASFWLACLLLVTPTIIAIVRQRDYWPFSHYPMFSRRTTPDQIVVYRLAIEFDNGEVRWWRPRSAHIRQRLGARFSQLARSGRRADARERVRLMADAQFVVLADDPDRRDAAALRVVRRHIEREHGRFVTCDELFARAPFPRSQVLHRATETEP